MAAGLLYPKADAKTQWFSGRYDSSPIDPDKGVLHTTETGDFPGYGGGASAPHLTYHCELHRWRQHYSLDESSRALKNAPGGVETNTDDAVQVELVAYSDEALARARGHLPVSEIDQQAKEDIAEFLAWCDDNIGVRLALDPGWVRSRYRDEHGMSFATWRGFTGWTGHNRVPENDHWDPAALPIDEIFAVGTRPPAPPLPEEDDDMPLYVVQRYGRQQWRLFTAGHPPLVISEWDYNTLVASGVPTWEQVHGNAIANAAVEILAKRIPGIDDTANAVQAFQAKTDAVSAYTRLKRVDGKLDQVLAAQGRTTAAAQVEAAVGEVDFTADLAARVEQRAAPVEA